MTDLLVNSSELIASGSGTPEGTLAAPPSSLYLRTDTGDLYRKATGTGTTGWVSAVGLSYVRESGGNLYLEPIGDVILDPAGNDVLPNTNYDINLGALSKKYLSVHAAELWVETLVAQNTIATIGGRVLVAPTNVLVADVAHADILIVVKYNNLASGDRVYLESSSKVEWMAITSGASGSAGAYTYSVTRDLDGTGGDQWYAGDAVLNTGQTGKGFIDLYSVSGVLSGSGPTIVGNVRTGSTYSSIAPRWAIGNLNGLYGYAAETYGAAFGDAGATNVTVDATNGFRIRTSTTNVFAADTSGNLTLSGNLTIGTAGVIKSGATALATGTGYWLSYNSGTPQFRIGNPSGAYLKWDGTNLELTAANCTINQNGVIVAMGSNSRSNDHAYAFSGTGSDYLGVYGNSVWTSGAGAELLSVLNTGTGSASNHVIAQAKTGSQEAYVFLDASEPNSWGRVWIYSSSGHFVFSPPVVVGGGTTHTPIFEEGSASWWFLKVTSSDERLKRDIHPLARGMAALREIVPIEFRWRESGRDDIGFSAQNCASVIPEAAPPIQSTGYYGFKLDPIVAVAVAAIRELDARIVALEAARGHHHH